MGTCLYYFRSIYFLGRVLIIGLGSVGVLIDGIFGEFSNRLMTKLRSIVRKKRKHC